MRHRRRSLPALHITSASWTGTFGCAREVRYRVSGISSAQEIAARLGGPVERLFVDGSGHALTADAKRLEVAEASRSFLRSYLEVRELRTA